MDINNGIQVERLVHHRSQCEKSKAAHKGRDVTEVASVPLRD